MLGGEFGVGLDGKKFGARFGRGEFAGVRVLLLKPWRYMNCSGRPVAEAVAFYRMNLCDVLVVLDDMWLEPGQVRLRARGSAGGHNGLADVIAALGTEDVPRLRVGVGRCESADAVDYVLSEPQRDEADSIEEGIGQAKEAAVCWLTEGIEAAMTKFNARPGDGRDSEK